MPVIFAIWLLIQSSLFHIKDKIRQCLSSFNWTSWSEEMISNMNIRSRSVQGCTSRSLRLAILGDNKVGKTSLLHRVCLLLGTSKKTDTHWSHHSGLANIGWVIQQLYYHHKLAKETSRRLQAAHQHQETPSSLKSLILFLKILDTNGLVVDIGRSSL